MKIFGALLQLAASAGSDVFVAETPRDTLCDPRPPFIRPAGVDFDLPVDGAGYHLDHIDIEFDVYAVQRTATWDDCIRSLEVYRAERGPAKENIFTGQSPHTVCRSRRYYEPSIAGEIERFDNRVSIHLKKNQNLQWPAGLWIRSTDSEACTSLVIETITTFATR